jgi:hypothetical protein
VLGHCIAGRYLRRAAQMYQCTAGKMTHMRCVYMNRSNSRIELEQRCTAQLNDEHKNVYAGPYDNPNLCTLVYLRTSGGSAPD